LATTREEKNDPSDLSILKITRKGDVCVLGAKKQKLLSADSAILTSEDIQSIHLWMSKMRQYRYYPVNLKVKKSKSTLNLNYPLIGHGLNRIVYDLNNGYVLKVAFSKLGHMSNENEYKIYKNSHARVQKHLCPIIESGDGWIIMKKMDSIVPMRIMELHKLNALGAKFLMYGIIPLDLRFANVAFSEDREIMVIDYGLFMRGFSNPFL
jgi:hypothetical protein